MSDFTKYETKRQDDPKKFEFTVTKEIGKVGDTNLRLDFGHFGTNKPDKFYLRRITEVGDRTYSKSFSFSGDELNALRDFLNS